MFPAMKEMTLDHLAACMRGKPRDALIVVRTERGLRRLVMVSAAYVRGDGLAEGEASGGARYAIVLEAEE